jgi:putative resolvase
MDIYPLLTPFLPWYTTLMKLSAYARQIGVTYKTAHRWWKSGKLDAYQLASGTIVVRQSEQTTSQRAEHVGLYARVSSVDQKNDLERQMERLKEYAVARGYHVTRMVSEIGSGLNDRRPKFLKLLTDPTVSVIIVEHRDRGTRFGFMYIEQLLVMQGRRMEVVFPKDTDDDLVNDFVSVITSMAARIYGRRNSRRKAKQIQQCVEHVMKQEGKGEACHGEPLANR